MFKLEARAIAALVLIGAVLIGGWALRHSGYKAGEAACRADMAAQVAEATQRSTEITAASDAREQSLETAYAAQVESLSDRHRAAVADLERRLRQLATRRSSAPETPSTPSAGHGREDGPGLAEGDAGIDQWLADAGVLARRGIAVGEGAERHRIGLQGLQQYGGEVNVFRDEVDRLNGAGK